MRTFPKPDTTLREVGDMVTPTRRGVAAPRAPLPKAPAAPAERAPSMPPTVKAPAREEAPRADD